MEPVEVRPVHSMSGRELLAALDAAHDELSRLQSYRHELLAAFEQSGHAAEFGAKNTVELISFRHRLPAAQVRGELKLAAALPKYATVGEALPSLLPTDDEPDEGGYFLHFGQAKAIVTALERIPTSAMVPVEDLQAAEQQLVKAAQHLNPADLARAGQRVRDILDTDGPEPAEEDAYRREALWYRKADQGIRIGGYLANENAELFSTLIHAGAKPHKTTDGRPDPRGRDKRQADALVAVLNAATGPGTVGPNLTITIDYNTLKNATAKPASNANAGADASADSSADCDDSKSVAANTNGLTAEDLQSSSSRTQPLPFGLGTGSGMGELVFGDNLSAAAVRRLACDAGVLPVVLGSNSQPLDVGTAKRFVTEPIRNALIARDRGCLICGAPPIMCDAHHIVHWIDGGPTSLANLGLFCKVHHREIHHGLWSVTIIDGIPRITRPPWADRPPPRRRLRISPNRPPDLPPGWPLAPAESLLSQPPTPTETPPGWPLAPAEPQLSQTPTAAEAALDRELTPAETRARSWPHDDDIPWMTPEDASCLDPWGDNSATSPPPPLAS
jgi:hypothetical protein